jgi:hypothetical protein
MSDVAILEHQELSPEFIGLLRMFDDLNHDVCVICQPVVYPNGVVGRMYTKALDCPLCGVKIVRGAEVLVRRDYEKHLDECHYPVPRKE